MKKYISLLAAFLVVFTLGMAPVLAYDGADENEIAQLTGADKLPESEYITAGEKTGDTKPDIGKKIFAIAKSSLLKFYKNGVKFFYSLIAVIVVAAALASFKGLNENSSLKTAFEFVSVLLLSGVLFAGLKPIFSFAAQSLDAMCVYMSALLPVTAALYAVGGNISQGVAGSSSLLVFLAVTERFAGALLNPLLQTGFVISIISALPGSTNMRSVSNFLKNAITTLLAFLFTLFGVMMYFQTVIAAAADNYAFRTVKFASGVFIPIIGNIIGEAAKTVAAAVGVVKASVGAVGLVSVAALALPPVVYVIMYKVFVLLAAMIARMLGLEKEAGMLYDVNGFMSVLMSIVVGTGVLFIIAIAMFIRIGVGD